MSLFLFFMDLLQKKRNFEKRISRIFTIFATDIKLFSSTI